MWNVQEIVRGSWRGRINLHVVNNLLGAYSHWEKRKDYAGATSPTDTLLIISIFLYTWASSYCQFAFVVTLSKIVVHTVRLLLWFYNSNKSVV